MAVINLTLPTEWNQLTVDQQLKAYSIIMGNRMDMLDPQEEVPAKRELLFVLLSGMDEKQFVAWQADCQNPEDEDGDTAYFLELEQSLKSIDFLFDIKTKDEGEDNERTEYAIALKLTKCPFPKFDRPKKKTGKKRSYYGPSDGLDNITFLELCVTFHLFEQYVKTYDQDILDELLATMYRSPKPKTKQNKYAGYHGDKRQPYLHHEALVPKRKKQIATLPREVKQLLAFWFASCRQQIIDQYPDLFDTSGKGQPSKYGWASTLMALAGNLSDLDTVSQQPAEDALTYLDYLNEQAKQAKIDAEMAKLKQ